MNASMYIELFGYLGSFLVVVSMLMSSVVKLRVINVIGSVISGTYALIIGSFPLALMNACLIIINIYNLFKLLSISRKYELVKGNINDAYFDYFVDHYGKDIDIYFPEFTRNVITGNIVYYVFCNESPAGLFVGNINKEGIINISLEYTTPTYRDCSVAKFLYIKLKENDVVKLCFHEPSEKHKSFLEKMGYFKDGKGYVKDL